VAERATPAASVADPALALASAPADTDAPVADDEEEEEEEEEDAGAESPPVRLNDAITTNEYTS
jgi:ribosomal protein L12E/L44/L45/RPP1/RPP2